MEGAQPMSGREMMLASIRSALAVNGREAPRRKEVADRLNGHPAGIVPARGHLPVADIRTLFIKMLAGAAGTSEIVASADAVPGAIGNFLRANNLPLSIRRGEDAALT